MEKYVVIVFEEYRKEIKMDNLDFKNPEYNNASVTIWSYLDFGYYPQTEVKRNEITTDIRQAEYDQDGDAWVNGVKYRRISRDDAENAAYFGNDAFRYFKWEKIKWRVLQNNGKTLFVMADKGIDCKAYNNVNESVDWEHCTIRRWLDNDFYNTAFDNAEQKAIVPHEVENGPVPGKYMGDGGNNIIDKIYILSIPELRSPAYGFWDDRMDWGYKKRDKKINRRIKASDYAHARGAWLCTDTRVVGRACRNNCRWWLRSPCSYTKYGAEVLETGQIIDVGFHTYIFRNAVVPVMHISLEELSNII